MNDADTVLGKREVHPSYAMLGFSRVTCSGSHPLFGSSIKHRDIIKLTLKRGHVRRNLNQDWYYGDGTLFEVEMSYTQFAELITAMNVGDGVPVTLRYIKGEGRIGECPFVDKGEIHLNEFKEHLREVYEDSQLLIQELTEMFATKKTFNKKDQAEILSTLRRISSNIGCNQDFQISQFQEQMEKTVADGKGEIESFFQNKLCQLAQMKLIETGTDTFSTLPPVEISGIPEGGTENV